MRIICLDRNSYIMRFAVNHRSGWFTRVNLLHVPVKLKIQVDKSCVVSFGYQSGNGLPDSEHFFDGVKILVFEDGRFHGFECPIIDFDEHLNKVQSWLAKEADACNDGELALHCRVVAAILKDYEYQLLAPAQ